MWLRGPVAARTGLNSTGGRKTASGLLRALRNEVKESDVLQGGLLSIPRAATLYHSRYWRPVGTSASDVEVGTTSAALSNFFPFFSISSFAFSFSPLPLLPSSPSPRLLSSFSRFLFCLFLLFGLRYISRLRNSWLRLL